jgi:hypothetical protein
MTEGDSAFLSDVLWTETDCKEEKSSASRQRPWVPSPPSWLGQNPRRLSLNRQG